MTECHLWLRLPGNLGQIKKLWSDYDTVGTVDLSEGLSPHTLAGFVKKALKDNVDDPLFPKQAQQLLAQAYEQSDDPSDHVGVPSLRFAVLTSVVCGRCGRCRRPWA